MCRYLLAWKKKGPALLVICGEVSPDIRFLIRRTIHAWRDHMGLPVSLIFTRNDADIRRAAEFPVRSEGSPHVYDQTNAA